MYRFNIISIKITRSLFTEIQKSTLKFKQKNKTHKYQKQSWAKRAMLRYHNTWLQIIVQIHTNKNNILLAKNSYEDEWNRIKYPKINSHTYNYLVFDKEEKKSLEKCSAKLVINIEKYWNFYSHLSLSTKINSQWIKGLNAKLETLKLLKGNVRKTLKL
jgi:hypothetical protein